jgi:hypothetical protein
LLAVNRGLRVALIVFQALWLNVLLPGHTRGVIVTPGTARQVHDCCRSEGAPGKDTPADSQRRAAHCAICFFAAHLSTPPVIDLSAPPLGLTDTLKPVAPTVCHAAEFVPTYLGRAPPMA